MIFTKTIIPFALVGYEVIIINSRYALVGYFITSYPTRAHGIIVIYFLTVYNERKVGYTSATRGISVERERHAGNAETRIPTENTRIMREA